MRIIIHSILWIAIIFYPTLIDRIYHLPPPLGIHTRITSISYKQSAKLASNPSTEIYLVSQTPFVLVLFVGEEGTYPRPSPTENGDCEGNLSFITWMDEVGIVDSPERGAELNQLPFAEQLLLLFLIHNQAFFGQSVSGPLMILCLATGTS